MRCACTGGKDTMSGTPASPSGLLPQLPGPSGSSAGGLAQRVASGYLQLIANVASAALGGGIAILLGVSPLPNSFPLVQLAEDNPAVTLGLGALFIVLV